MVDSTKLSINSAPLDIVSIYGKLFYNQIVKNMMKFIIKFICSLLALSMIVEDIYSANGGTHLSPQSHLNSNFISRLIPGYSETKVLGQDLFQNVIHQIGNIKKNMLGFIDLINTLLLKPTAISFYNLMFNIFQFPVLKSILKTMGIFNTVLILILLTLKVAFPQEMAAEIEKEGASSISGMVLLAVISMNFISIIVSSLILKIKSVGDKIKNFKFVIAETGQKLSLFLLYLIGMTGGALILKNVSQLAFSQIFGEKGLEFVEKGLANPAFAGHEWLGFIISLSLLFITGIIPFVIMPYYSHFKKYGKSETLKLLKNDLKYFVRELAKCLPIILVIVFCGFILYFSAPTIASAIYSVIVSYSELAEGSAVLFIAPLHMVVSDLLSQLIEKYRDAKKDNPEHPWKSAFTNIDLANTGIFLGLGIFKGISLPLIWGITKFLFPNGQIIGWFARSIFDMAFMATILNLLPIMTVGIKDDLRKRHSFKEKLAAFRFSNLKNIWIRDKWPGASRFGGYFLNLWITWTIEEAFCLGPNGEGGFAVLLDTLFDIPWNMYLSWVSRKRGEEIESKHTHTYTIGFLNTRRFHNTLSPVPALVSA